MSDATGANEADDPASDAAFGVIDRVSAERDALVRWAFGPSICGHMWMTIDIHKHRDYYPTEAKAVAAVAATVKLVLVKMGEADAK